MVTCAQCGHENAVGSRFCARCGAGLEPDPEDDRAAVASPVASGTIFDGKYQVLQEIGRGGMGVVYRGHDLSLGRMVAIKVLPEQFNTDDEVIGRFKREARAMAALDHPNIVPVYAIGQERSFHYFVMKFLEGATVAELLDQMRRADPDVARFDAWTVQQIITQACKGLGHAHRRGLVHRDIKPGNLMVSPENHVTIMDFGIVKETSAVGEPGVGPITRTGLVFGTPEYMSPEQAQGRQAPGPQADLYSLGVVAYEMLTGNAPFRGDSPFSIVLKHIKEPVPPIVGRIADVSEAFEAAVFKALAKHLDERYVDADEMAQALSAVDPVSGARISLAPSSATVPPAPIAPKRRVITIENEPLPAGVLGVGLASPAPPAAGAVDSDDPLSALAPPFAPLPSLGAGPLDRGSLDLLPPRVLGDSEPPRVAALPGPPPVVLASMPESRLPMAPRPQRPPLAGSGRAPLQPVTGDADAVVDDGLAVLEDRPGHYRHLVTAQTRQQALRRRRRWATMVGVLVALAVIGVTGALILR